MASDIDRVEILRRFRSMYENKRLEHELFDIGSGYLQTTLSTDDRMSLAFFCDYNNLWWFAVIDRVDVPAIAYDPDSDIGTILLDIYYGPNSNDVLRACQAVKFAGDRISYIRTYASGEFFNGPNPLVRLDRAGNEIWLGTGYDFDYSCRAAELYFESPHGVAFANDPATATAVSTIKARLEEHRSAG